MAKSFTTASLHILGLLLLVSLAHSKTEVKHIRLFDHEFKGNTSEHEQTIYPIVGLPNVPWGFNTFGTLFIGQNILKESISWGSRAVGYLHGIVGVTSLNGTAVEALATVHFTSGKFDGSTLAIHGIIGQDREFTTLSEVAIVGGTKKFRSATGYMTFTGTDIVNATGHNVYQLDLYIRQELEDDYPTVALY